MGVRGVVQGYVLMLAYLCLGRLSSGSVVLFHLNAVDMNAYVQFNVHGGSERPTLSLSERTYHGGVGWGHYSTPLIAVVTVVISFLKPVLNRLHLEFMLSFHV